MDGNDTTGITGNPPPGHDIANDFFGKACRIQPQDGELLVVSRNFRSPGCDLQSFAPPAPGSGDMDVLQLYKDLRPSVTYFKMSGATDGSGKEPAGVDKVWGGSGVAVAKEADDCLVITDDHVPKGVPEQHVKASGMKVAMANGKDYDASVITSDPGHDLALVKVNTGADTDKVCKAAAVTEQPVAVDGTQNVITMGQPYTSHAIYTSTGTLSQVQKRSDINFMIKPLPGEDPDRPILSQYVPIHEGFSGAGVFTKDGKLVSLDDLGTSPFASVSTPVTRSAVDDMIAQRIDKP